MLEGIVSWNSTALYVYQDYTNALHVYRVRKLWDKSSVSDIFVYQAIRGLKWQWDTQGENGTLLRRWKEF